MGVDDRLVVGASPALASRLRALAARRLVFFAGVPGTGKSLLVHQLCHLAAGAERRAHLLQWDVARPVFEASPAGRRYPLKDRVTHPVIRKAAGLWVRDVVAAWNAHFSGPEHLLVGETPFVGGRFVELARPARDRAEVLLSSPSCRFVLAVPSRDVRRVIEAERERRSANPRHPREREDAPPTVLRGAWREVAAAARELGIDATGDGYDPLVYRGVYETILRHRHLETIGLDVVLPTSGLSVYDFDVAPTSLVPTVEEAEAFIERVERDAQDGVLDLEIARWWAG